MLEHVLAGNATINPEFGFLLNTTFRMTSEICEFISEEFYEGKLNSHDICNRRNLGKDDNGLRWVPVQHHEDRVGHSIEEANMILAIVKYHLGKTIVGIDPQTNEWEIHCTGLRNPYDFAFNRHGDLFTFDSDNERDVGTAWYRPTRICHLVSGAEFGWRSGSGKWPQYFPDSLPPAVELGQGSPTGVAFGYGLKFPRRYREALYSLDWTFGRIHAVHLSAKGSSPRWMPSSP